MHVCLGLVDYKDFSFDTRLITKVFVQFCFFQTHPQNKTKQNITKQNKTQQKLPSLHCTPHTLTPPDFPDSRVHTDDDREWQRMAEKEDIGSDE